MRVRVAKQKSDIGGLPVLIASRPVSCAVLAIDPGLVGTGVAVFKGISMTLTNVGVFHTPSRDRGMLWSDRALRLATDVWEWAQPWLAYIPQQDVTVVSEFPMKMERASGIAAQKYATMRMAFLVGALAQLFAEYKFVPVTPIQWKGQLPKSVIQRRIEQKLGKDRCRSIGIRSHAWDAVGIGLWYMGAMR